MRDIPSTSDGVDKVGIGTILFLLLIVAEYDRHTTADAWLVSVLDDQLSLCGEGLMPKIVRPERPTWGKILIN